MGSDAGGFVNGVFGISKKEVMSEHQDMGWAATNRGIYRLVDLVYVESLALWLRAINRWPGDCQRIKERACLKS